MNSLFYEGSIKQREYYINAVMIILSLTWSMEKLGNILAIWIHRKRFLIQNYNSNLSINQLSFLIIVFFAVLPLTVYFVVSNQEYTWFQIMAFYIMALIPFTLAIITAIGWYKAKEMAKADVEGFSFIEVNLKNIDQDYFGFDDSDLENLELLTNQLPCKEKITIREVPKNKLTGNLRFLFSFLDHIIEEGIQGFGKESRDSLLRLVQKRFSFDGSEINPNTFASSYSKWLQKTKEGDYSDTRKAIAKALCMS